MKNLIVLFALTTSVCFGQTKNQAAIVPDANMILLMDEAKQLMKIREDVPFPEIYPATFDFLKSLVCNGSSYCPVNAVYTSNKVYYRQDLNFNDLHSKSILVHEFVHHIQANIGYRAVNCDIWYKNEKEAYRLQAKYLRNNDQDDTSVREAVRIIKCP